MKILHHTLFLFFFRYKDRQINFLAFVTSVAFVAVIVRIVFWLRLKSVSSCIIFVDIFILHNTSIQRCHPEKVFSLHKLRPT